MNPAPAQEPQPRLPPYRLRVTPFLIGMNVAVFIAMVARGVSPMQPTSDQLLGFGANFGVLVVLEQQWWRPFTSMFVHIGAVHLLINMYSLWNVGGFVERLLGRPMYAAVYVLTGLAGSFTSVLWHPLGVSAGASGAIFGLFGVIVGFTFSARARLPPQAFQSLRSSIIATLAFNLLFALTTPFLDHAAHLGGLLVGVLAGMTATDSAFEQKAQRPTWGSQLIVLATVVALGVLAETRTRNRKQLRWEPPAMLAIAAFEDQRWGDAVLHSTHALEKRNEPTMRELRGMAQVMLGQYAAGAEDLRQSHDSAHAKNAYAWALVWLNRDLDEALKMADAAVLSEASAAYLGTRCWVHVARGEPDEARRDCESAVKQADDDLMDRGMLRFIENDMPGALKLWDEAAAQRPEYARDLEPWLARARGQPDAGS